MKDWLFDSPQWLFLAIFLKEMHPCKTWSSPQLSQEEPLNFPKIKFLLPMKKHLSYQMVYYQVMLKELQIL